MESGNSVVFMQVCCTLVVAWQCLYKGPYTSKHRWHAEVIMRLLEWVGSYNHESHAHPMQFTTIHIVITTRQMLTPLWGRA